MGTFWEDFSFNVTHKLGLTYREVQKRKGMKLYSEAKLQQSILNPILHENVLSLSRKVEEQQKKNRSKNRKRDQSERAKGKAEKVIELGSISFMIF